ncbi:riboflavin synthase subunit alpha [Undibacterium sp. RuTC16W]|uniref:riboflavin synthase subunit alpha n=1 Tax=Undibacterium sp. RuTC16W TaxID=3413048 RepID=UPI003BF14C59
MFTGIVQGIARIATLSDKPGLRTFKLDFPEGFCKDLEIGASVAVDGVCLTVTALPDDSSAEFDVMQQSLAITTLGAYQQDGRVNVERAARDGAEIGGHPLSGHIDFKATIAAIRELENNYVIRIAVPPEWLRYIFAKGYIAINGASLTVAEVNREEGWFEVWLIPETLRMTVFAEKKTGAALNIEIERATQVVVDTVRAMLTETLGPLLPALEALLKQQGVALEELVKPGSIKP